jgi:hypothetical protein
MLYKKLCLFFNITPCSLVKVSRRLGETYLLHPEQAGLSYSETWIDFQPTRERYIPEDITALNLRDGNLKSYTYALQISLIIYWR